MTDRTIQAAQVAVHRPNLAAGKPAIWVVRDVATGEMFACVYWETGPFGTAYSMDGPGGPADATAWVDVIEGVFYGLEPV